MPLAGIVHVKVSERGRFSAPSCFQHAFELGVFICRGFEEGCLFLMPFDTWTDIRKRLNSISPTDKSAQTLQRFFGAGSEIWPDSRGRLTIPTGLREFAPIGREALLVGGINRVELWSEDAWERHVQEHFTRDALTELMRQVDL